MSAAVGLADLLRSLAALPPETRLDTNTWDAHAHVLGLRRAGQPAPTTEPSRPRPVSLNTPSVAPPSHEPQRPVQPVDIPPMPFWRAVYFDMRDDVPARSMTKPAFRPLTEDELQAPDEQPDVRVAPIEPWSRLWPRLAAHLAAERPSSAPDTKALVNRIAQALPPQRIPRRRRRAWADRAVIVHDRDPDDAWLIPDQAWLDRRLHQVMGQRGVDVRLLSNGPDGEPFDPHQGTERDWPSVVSGTPLLVLGGFARDAVGSSHTLDEREQAWNRLGLRLRRRGYHPAVLIARPAARAMRGLSRSWSLLPWERHSWSTRASSADRRSRTDRLLSLTAPAVVVSVALLRELRSLLSAEQADIGTEADVWAHPDVVVTPYGFRFVPARTHHWLQQFVSLHSVAMQRAAWQCIRRHQQRYGREVNYLSTWRLLEPSTERIVEGESAEAIAVAQRLGVPGTDASVDDMQRGLRAWFRALCPLLPGERYGHEHIGEGLSRMWHQSHDEHARPPEGLDPWLRPPPPASVVREIALVHRSTGGLWLGGEGSPVARVPFIETVSMRGRGRVLRSQEPIAVAGDQLEIRTDVSVLRVLRAPKPSWASAVRRDMYGLRAECEIAGVAFGMRWIPPGRFLMGSPDDEPGRDDDEIRHEVIVTHGYWLAETPCTQALWTAVTKGNPSYFRSPDRPVESLSFRDVSAFIESLNQLEHERQRGEPLRLPTEVEWEYACRAGTREATYAGPLEILGENHAPILDGIAWYGGNSGNEFELDNGIDSVGWLKKQYPHQRAGTHPVALKRCNPWGLYDTLGNVWEWCVDGLSPYSHKRRRARYEPADRHAVHAYRVVRGGSWRLGARYVRAAYRFWVGPTIAYVIVGFRLARGQPG